MSTVLVITSSPRGERSVSSALASQFARQWARLHPEDVVRLRDIGHHPVPHVTEPWITGVFEASEPQTEASKAAVAVSNQLVDEFLAADRYIFGVPMHNFHIPSTLKAYIDQIVRPGRTFAVGPNGFEGLAKGKKALFVTSSGGSYVPGSPTAGLNLQEPYLRTIFGFMGIADVQFVTAENTDRGQEAARKARQHAEFVLQELVSTW